MDDPFLQRGIGTRGDQQIQRLQAQLDVVTQALAALVDAVDRFGGCLDDVSSGLRDQCAVVRQILEGRAVAVGDTP